MIGKSPRRRHCRKIEARDRIAWRMVWVLIAPTVLADRRLRRGFRDAANRLVPEPRRADRHRHPVRGLYPVRRVAWATAVSARRLRRCFRPADRSPANRRASTLLAAVFVLRHPCNLSSFLILGVGFNRLEQVDRFLALGGGGMLIAVTAFYLAPLVIGPGWLDPGLRNILNDEFMRDLRGRAMRLGYLTMVVGGGGGAHGHALASRFRPGEPGLGALCRLCRSRALLRHRRLAREPRWLSGASATASRNSARREG